MTAKESTAGIVDAIRHGITQGPSTSVSFVARLPGFDAALLAAVIGGVLGLVSGERP